jgi:hypothetical protein
MEALLMVAAGELNQVEEQVVAHIPDHQERWAQVVMQESDPV